MQPDWEIWLDSHISPIIAKWLKEKAILPFKSSYTIKPYNLSDLDIYLNFDNRILFSILERNLIGYIRLLLDFNKDIIELQ